jgi:hypothetical protein
MIDEETAEAWIFEFQKFVTILIIETDPDFKIYALPSSKIEWVFQTFLEQGKKCHSFFQFFFDELITPEAHIIHHDRLENYTKRYSQTLKTYKELFGNEPPKEIWESVEERFEDLTEEKEETKNNKLETLFADPNAKVWVNINRIVIAKILLKNSGDAFNPSVISIKHSSGSSNIKATLDIQKQIEKAKEGKEAYRWRQMYPHWNNIYFQHLISPDGHIFVKNNYEIMAKISTIFKPGGVLFFRNPYDPSLTSILNIPDIIVSGFYDKAQIEKMKDITLDHLADCAIPNQDTVYGTWVGGKPLKNDE